MDLKTKEVINRLEVDAIGGAYAGQVLVCLPHLCYCYCQRSSSS